MKKYKCKICNKFLLIGTFKARMMHLQGAKHKSMKKTLFIELLENNLIQEEVKSITKQIDPILLSNINIGFRMPPCEIPKNFVIPEAPKNFALPKYFNFSDPKNFCNDLNETCQFIYDKLYKN